MAGPRIAAYLLDIGLATMITFGVLRLVDVSPERLTSLIVVLTLAGWAVVRVAGPAIAGESPGKRMMQLCTVDAGGAPIPGGLRALRELVIWLIYWVPFVALVDAFVVERGEHRSMRDRMAGTYVVHASDGPASGGRAATVLLLAVLALGVSGTGIRAVENRHRVEHSFVVECVRSGLPAGQCQCVFDHISGRLPADRVAAADWAIRHHVTLPADVKPAFGSAFRACGPAGRPAPAQPA